MDIASAQRALQVAQAALQQGRLKDARSALTPLRKALPRDKAVLYLAARLARAEGDPRGAAKLLEKALRTASRDAPLWAEYASTLDDAHRFEEAEKAYTKSLKLEPGLVDAAIDLAILRHRRLGRPNALDDLRRLAAANPEHLRAWRNLALLEREEFATGPAIRASEHVLARAPNDAMALSVRAYAEFDSGRSSLAHFNRALAAVPRDMGLAVKYAAALHAERRSHDADRVLGQVIGAEPFNIDALHARAQIRWEAALEGDPLASFADAVARPGCPAAVWGEYARLAERHRDPAAAMEIARRARVALGDRREVELMTARAACEADDFSAHADIFDAIARHGDTGADLLRARWLARMHRWDELSRLGQKLLRAGHARDILPYLSLAWRGSDPERWHWLERDGALVGTLDIGGRLRDLGALAEYLRRVHSARQQPLEQSLRGGTQTDGMLFARMSPEIDELRNAIADAVAEYLAQLPPHDPKHPWLSLPREVRRFTGSWSVRLQSSGYHVAHIHNRGDVSSACYIALPQTLGSGDSLGEGPEDGWLFVGEAPREFGLDWEPVRLVRPEEGMLALFPSWAWHGTRPFSAGERLTVAFDAELG